MRRNWEKHHSSNWNLCYLLCEPPVFEHVPAFDKRFRGSGRLASMAPNTATEDSYYITLSLTQEWGLSNRMNTILTMSYICSLTRFGLYICWEPCKACPGRLGDVFDINSDHPLFNKVPFVQVFDDANNGNWKAAKNNQHWCKANFESQCSIRQGLTYFLTSLKTTALQNNDKYMLNTLLPQYKEELVFDKLNFSWR